MPLYEYECLKCSERFEVIQKFSDAPYRHHKDNSGSTCDGNVQKLLSAPAFQFKGTGWYVTDYGKGGSKPEKTQEASDSKSELKSSSSSDSNSSKSETSKSNSKASEKKVTAST